MNSKNDWIRDYLGITAWHKAGYTGSRGLTLSGEDFENAGSQAHPSKTYQAFREIAPGRKVEYCDLKNVDDIAASGADSMYVSISYSTNDKAWQQAIDSKLGERQNVYVSAGNHRGEKENKAMSAQNVYGVGAARLYASEMYKGVPTPNATINITTASYSAPSQNVDFGGVTDLYLDDDRTFGGTSCACPMLCGLVALVNDFFIAQTGRPLTREAMYRFLKDNARPQYEGTLGERDNDLGWGLPVLPAPETIDISKYCNITQPKGGGNLQIVDNYITCNYRKANMTPKYIVIHYFGGLGTAKSTAGWFGNPAAEASAHYVLDEGDTIYHCVSDHDVAWHCGSKNGYVHPECRNNNSIGIEARPAKISSKTLQAADTDWYFKPQVIDNLVWLTKKLMKQYNIPAERVIRHYDVTGKLCPRPMCGKDTNAYYKTSGDAQWALFKARLTENTEEDEDMTLDKFKELMQEYRAELQDNDCGAWSKEAREWAIANGLIGGMGTLPNGETNYAWCDQLTREQMATLLYRFAKFMGKA